MIKVWEVGERIYQISEVKPVSDPRDRTASYLVWGEKSALIETGPACDAPTIKEGFRRLGFDARALAYIIPTHIHIDHAGGAGLWARELPQAKVVLHPQGVGHMVDPTRLIASTRQNFGDDFEVRLGPILPVPPAQVHEARDGELISLGDRELKIIFTPGHAPHHICILDMKGWGLFSGEALGIPHLGSEDVPLPVAAPPSFDLEQAFATLERLKALKPAVIFYSHYWVGWDAERRLALFEGHLRAFRDMLEAAFRAGESLEQMQARLRAYVLKNANGSDYAYPITVAAFAGYFKRKAGNS